MIDWLTKQCEEHVGEKTHKKKPAKIQPRFDVGNAQPYTTTITTTATTSSTTTHCYYHYYYYY